MRRFGSRGGCVAVAVIASVLLAVLPGVTATAQTQDGDQLQGAIAKNTGKLQKLRDEITAGKNRISHLNDQENEVVRGVEKIQRDIEMSRKLLVQMAERERMLNERSKLLGQELATSSEDFAGRRETLAGSLRAMYLRGERGELEGILTAQSFSDMMTRLKLQRMLARMEAQLVSETRRQASTILHDKKQQEAALAELVRSRLDMDRENDHLELLLAEQQAALRDLKDQRQEVNDHLLELSLNEQKLTYVLSDLDKQREARAARQDSLADKHLVELAGILEWPVRGALLRGFGRSVHPKFQTVTLNNGVNIAATEGAPVAAVASGVVEFQDQLPGFGQCVILDHGQGYYTLYAFLERVFVAAGARVAKGQVIAEVGRPSADEESQLYFEIRKGRTPLDPEQWLRTR